MSGPAEHSAFTRSTRAGADDYMPTDDTLLVLSDLRARVAADRTLRWAALVVFIYLLPELLDRRHRIIKQDALARAIRMGQNNVSRALRTLVRGGYLERGPNEGTLHTYRVAPDLLASWGYPQQKSQPA